MFQQKLKEYWTSAINSCGTDSKALWSKLRTQMSPPSPLNLSRFSADEFATHFATKIDKIRASTATAPSPVIDMRTVAEKLTSFEPVTTDEITRLLSRSPAKHCLLDPVPTWLLKRASDILAPVLSVMCNASMQSGKFPDTHKQATVFPRLKSQLLTPMMPILIDRYLILASSRNLSNAL